MTLKEKFAESLESDPKFIIYNAEKIADDYAIEFACWCEWDNTEKAIHTYEELLKIFKKEKGLC